ncbi:succinylglutamate desuccinylase [Pelistega indica]|uniref:Succinylglutamate desuccinylase n=1 Tax=Pelistega indica TaxID=1414851 RepID=V8FZK6_9BURK|nr:succinylglutamate desuccinylase/aspartoacylase family protein [Pelistega indica]ETD69610.1 succinylglutamate desuccinylase [Pelistega indica]
MRTELLPIDYMTPGMQAHVTALHFGDESLPKIYMQSSLHADEMPGSVAAFYLHKKLLKLEQEGRLKAHIVLVPMCNPLGLAQSINYMHIGRFHLPTGQNFNRLFTVPMKEALFAELDKNPFVFSKDAKENTKKMREVIKRVLDDMKPSSNVHSMHLNLLSLSHDADIVLDLHCDNFARLHMYTMPSTWEPLEPLARYLQSECQLLSANSNANSFDEIFSTLWASLIQRYPNEALEQATISSTVEFRGEYDLSHENGQKDADGIIQYLGYRGYIDLADQKPLPDLVNEPHPLEGLYYLPTPTTGIVVYRVKEGEWVSAGQEVADILNPITGECTAVTSPHYGFVFALSGSRVAMGERKLMSISSPFDIGNHNLSP